jgi:methylene-tetrahydromethanopterin dehydrogenase
VACVERWLREGFNQTLKGKHVLVLGGTGPVGTACAVLTAQEGAQVQVGSSSDVKRAQSTAAFIRSRYDVETQPVLSDRSALDRLIEQADVVIAAAKAGVEAVPADALAKAGKLLVAADVNAVPPAGIAGVEVMDDGEVLKAAASGQAKAIGALAIGNVKYQVERGLFESMLNADKALYLDFVSAFAKAREVIQAARK